MSMLKCTFYSAILLTASFGAGAIAGNTESPRGATVYFENIKNGDTLPSPFTVKFGISGMTLAPAGADAPNTGHHHLIIDEPAVAGDDLAYAIPVDDHHKHFGKAQTEATISLPKGRHTLQLLLADGGHMAHTPPVMSDRITITIE